MTDPSFAIVVTTIGAGDFLAVYARKAAAEGLLDRTTLIVVPDRKTPAALGEAVNAARRKGLRVRCPDLAEQEAYIARFGAIGEAVPWNSDARRNIGFLMAYESGADAIIAIDDDNLCELPGPWLAEHGVVTRPAAPLTVTASASGWYNPCDLLDIERPEVYPRGYPYAVRGTQPALAEVAMRGRVDVNAGLWLGAPDVDAFTHLAGSVQASALRGSAVLHPDSWAPVNTQNTAVRREAMGAWWYVLMGETINTLPIQRYGDILSGYFLLACARQVGGLVRFGTPLVMHRRNSHDIGRDALGELPGIWLMEDILPWLQALQLSGRDYVEVYRVLADALDDFAGGRPSAFWTESSRGFVTATTRRMRSWTDAIRILDGR